MILFPTVATQNDGTVLSEENDNAVQDWNGQVESVETSDVTVVTVSKDASGDTVTLRPISAGEATVTVELASGHEYTKTITVEEAAREVTKATAEDVSFSSEEGSVTVKGTVVDQYGDPVEDATIYAHPLKTFKNR